MHKIINIGDKTYRCKIFKTEEEKAQGLMNVEFLPPDEGALFIWDEEGLRKMWMKNTLIPLDQIAINDSDEVTMVYPAQPNDETLIPFNNAKYILEVNQNSGIKIGDDFEIDEEDDLDKYVMKVIGSDGGTQFLLQGGERIFSRISTRKMIRWAKKAEAAKNDIKEFEKICKRLGKVCFKELYAQDHRKPEYVEVPESKENQV